MMNDTSNAQKLTQLHLLADACAYDFAAAARHGDEEFLGTGADLEPSTLLHAYRSGVFPWFGADEPICWWSPKVRCVLAPSDFQPSKSLMRTAKKQPWTITTNQAFDQVMLACSQPRSYTDDTWIHSEMIEAYSQLHQLSAASSIEVWAGAPQLSELVGGLYGVSLGAIFCGESMFHTRTDASKIAFWALMHFSRLFGIALIDCQMSNPHLMRLGATSMPKAEFLDKLGHLVMQPSTGLNDTQYQLSTQELLAAFDNIDDRPIRQIDLAN